MLQVKLKQEVLNQAARSGGSAKRGPAGSPAYSSLTGDAWYSQQASRAVNQAIGRVRASQGHPLYGWTAGWVSGCDTQGTDRSNVCHVRRSSGTATTMEPSSCAMIAFWCALSAA